MPKSTSAQVLNLFKRDKEKSERKTKEQYDEYLLTLRNDNTNADEAAIWIKFILYVLTAFVVYLGFNYYLSTFSEMLPPLPATAFALLLPIVIEVGKLKLVTKAFRSISLGWIDQGPAKSFFWGIVLVIGGGCFWWSYTISTGGIKEVAKQSAETKNRQAELSTLIGGATSDIDKQIAALQQSNTDAGSLKTKKGKTNWGAQPILADNAKSLASLQEQRRTIVEQTTAEYNDRKTDNQTKVSAWASFIERFGGWGEIGSLFCLIALAVFERILRDHNLADAAQENTQEEPLPYFRNGNIKHQSAHEGINTNGQQRHTENNTAQRYYFNRPSPTGNVQSALDLQPLWKEPKETVPQSENTVPQPNAFNPADAVLELCRQNIQREMSNFRNTQAKKESVARRISEHLDMAFIAMRSEAFAPSYTVGVRLYAYLQDEVFPVLNSICHPYLKDDDFIKLLYERFKPQEQPA